MKIGRVVGGYKFEKRLGKGRGGEVYSVSRTGIQYAIRIMEHEETRWEMNFGDIKIISPFLLKYFDCFRDSSTPGKIFVVMELCQKGDLYSFISQLKSLKGTVLSFNRVMGIFIQLTLGLYALHRSRIIHGNLNAANVFIDSEDNCKIGDYGMTTRPPPYFLSPEILQGQRYDSTADIWALGVLMYYICTLDFPFQGSYFQTLILAGKFNPISEDLYSSELCDLIHSLLVLDPQERPSAADILKKEIMQTYAQKLDLLKYFSREIMVAQNSSPPAPTPNANAISKPKPKLTSLPSTAPPSAPPPTHAPAPVPALAPVHIPASVPAPAPVDEVTEYIQATAANNPETSFTAADFRREFEDALGRKAKLPEVTLFLKAQKNERTQAAGNNDKVKELQAPKIGQSLVSEVVNGYRLIDLLGRGSFGEVYRSTKDGREYAIKHLDESKLSAQMEQSFATNISANLNCPFLVRYYETFRVKSNRSSSSMGDAYVVMELCPQGDLNMLLKTFRGVKDAIINPTRIIKILIQLALGLEVLHRYKILHRDLKPENVFVDQNDNVKIGDFGCAKELEYTSQKAHTIIGTPLYESPEVCSGEDYDSSSDMWAVGVMLYELCTLERPFNDPNPHKLSKLIIAGKYKDIPKFRCPDEIRGIVKGLLTVNSKERLSAFQILQDKFIQESAKDAGLLKAFPPRARGK